MRRRLLAASATVAGLATYALLLREPVLTWGATRREARERLPGDELIATRDGVATRAISVDAAPEFVWPWLAQMGPAPRGGIYTYDWIENLFGLDMHSADEVLEEFQNPEPGLAIEFGGNTMVAELVEPNAHLVWRSSDGNWVWSFVLVPDGAGGTRLLSRNSYRLPRLIDRIGMLPMEPASLVMERKMLLGFKQRAEALAARAKN
jgi:hypothetical protein